MVITFRRKLRTGDEGKIYFYGCWPTRILLLNIKIGRIIEHLRKSHDWRPYTDPSTQYATAQSINGAFRLPSFLIHRPTSAEASLLRGYLCCAHEYLERGKLLWKTSIGRRRRCTAMKSDWIILRVLDHTRLTLLRLH